MKQPITLPTEIESLGPNDHLSQEQLDLIAKEKDEPWDQPAVDKIEDPLPGGDPAKDKDETKAKSAEELEAEVAEKAEKDAKDAEANAAKVAADKATAEENARLDKKAKELGKTAEEVKELEASEKAEAERLEKVAKEEGLTVEQVKEQEAKDLAIAERHGKDPIKIARALRKEQSEFGKLQNEVKDLRDLKVKVEAAQVKFNEQHFNDQMEKGRDDIVAKYREKYPAESADLSDEVVFERGKVLIKEGLKKKEEAYLSDLKTKATTVREEVVKALPEEFKEYVPEIKKLIAECSDEQVLDKGFDPKYIALMVRGQKFTPDYVKSLEEGAYKRGIEKAKIIPKVPAGRPNAGGGTGGGGSDLSDKEKARAEEMYGRRDGWTKERMWDEYAKSDKKDDSVW